MSLNFLPTASHPAQPLTDSSLGALGSSRRDAESNCKTSDSLLELVRRQHLFSGLTDNQLRLVCSLAMEVHYPPDQWIFREGDPANRFFIILKGYVTIEVEDDSRIIPIRNLGPGDDLGWAWLFPPYYMHFSARTSSSVRAIFFYGTRLRELCEQDHELGYQLMKRVARMLVRNLKATERCIFPHSKR